METKFKVGDTSPDWFEPANCGCVHYAEENRLCPHDIAKLNAPKQFDKGDPVMTPSGPGTVVYKRMASPDYTTVQMYSVALESRVAESAKPPFPSYSGTAFPADQVSERI